eukprot:scaffold3700_cov387-Prasinococcus_capsulatus_cf.AAC.3
MVAAYPHLLFFDLFGIGGRAFVVRRVAQAWSAEQMAESTQIFRHEYDLRCTYALVGKGEGANGDSVLV